MNSWQTLPAEERALLNPAFCSSLLWQAANGFLATTQSSLPFEIAFLVLPIALHQRTREALPRTSATSIPTWLHDNARLRPTIANRARLLNPFTKEAIIFGCTYSMLSMKRGGISAANAWKAKVVKLKGSDSEEVRDCVRLANFLGKWFGRAGSAPTIMSIFGVRP
jgi:hypothetical protein